MRIRKQANVAGKEIDSGTLCARLTAGDAAATVADNAVVINAQTWLDQVKADLNLTPGEITMWIPDMPNVPPQNVPVMIAQASQAQAGGAAATRAVGVCSPVPSNYYSAENGLAPIYMAQIYLNSYENRDIAGPATTNILQQPKHGVLRLVTEADRGTLFDSEAGPLKPEAQLYAYLPDSSYVGNDTASIQVDFGNGLKVNVKYYFQAISGGLADDWMGTYCSKTGPYWKISSTLDVNGNFAVNSVEYQSPNIPVADTAAHVTAGYQSRFLFQQKQDEMTIQRTEVDFFQQIQVVNVAMALSRCARFCSLRAVYPTDFPAFHFN